MSDMPGFLDFTRPGKGYVDDMQYPPFIRFWKRFGRNFSKLLAVNLVFAIITLPIYIWLASLVNVASIEAGGGALTILGNLMLYYAMMLPGPVLAALLVGSILLMGPMAAALSYSCLNCAWDRPGLFWDGFREALRFNWKQALPFGLLDALAGFVTICYLVDGVAVFGALGGVLKVFWIVLLLVYGMIRVYVYPIMVTMELSFGDLIKNSLILALLIPWRPALTIAITALLVLLCLVIDIVLVPFFLYSFVAFLAAFLAQPVMDKYLLSANKEH